MEGAPPLQPSKPGTQRANKIVRVHDYLCQKGRPRYTWHFPCASEQSASAQCKHHVHIEPNVRHMSENLWKRARGFGTSFSCTRAQLLTYPNKIDQSRCLKRVHLHFNLPLPPVYSHPRPDNYTYVRCHTMPPKTSKKTVAKKDGKAK